MLITNEDIQIVRAQMQITREMMGNPILPKDFMDTYVKREIAEGLVNEMLKNDLVNIYPNDDPANPFIVKAEIKILKKKEDK